MIILSAFLCGNHLVPEHSSAGCHDREGVWHFCGVSVDLILAPVSISFDFGSHLHSISFQEQLQRSCYVMLSEEPEDVGARDGVGLACLRVVLARVTGLKASLSKKRLMSASRSTELKGVEETRMEASQSLTKQSWKKRWTTPALVLGLVICLVVIVS
ncbi:hypothetical protein OIU79_020677 [Salix purpurea]|uniref:Uncharacterized protein n=1 Tax=Salix purpurea TaxID=77065 RepID=A0A9Q0WM72_SALPP|nr:hypothetical protein OIU79_020677 [Salix purpurea]